MNTFFKTIPKLAFLFGGNAHFRSIGICLKLWIVLVATEVFHVSMRTPIVVQFKDNFFTFIFSGKADISVCKEIFLEEEYYWKLKKTPHTIIDIGAHVGDTALYYHSVYPDAVIYALEPDPGSYQRLVEHTKAIASIIPVHVAITNTTGTGVLHQSSKSSLRGSLLERELSETSVSVPLMTLRDFFVKYNLSRADLIKFDIEGAEKDMFGIEPPIAYADAYIGEVHCDLADINPEVFRAQFTEFTVDMQPIGKKNRFNFKALAL